jgi:hypothetical protein
MPVAVAPRRRAAHDGALRSCDGKRRTATIAKAQGLESGPRRLGTHAHRMAVAAALLISVACGTFVAAAALLAYKLAARMIVQ